MADKTQKEFYEEAQAYISKEMDKIEEWITELETHPHIEYGVEKGFNIARGYGTVITGVKPVVVDTVNKEELLKAWIVKRREIEWFKDVKSAEEVDI